MFFIVLISQPQALCILSATCIIWRDSCNGAHMMRRGILHFGADVTKVMVVMLCDVAAGNVCNVTQCGTLHRGAAVTYAMVVLSRTHCELPDAQHHKAGVIDTENCQCVMLRLSMHGLKHVIRSQTF